MKPIFADTQTKMFVYFHSVHLNVAHFIILCKIGGMLLYYVSEAV